MADSVVTIRVIIANRKAVQTLADALDLLEEITADAPWNEDAKEALEKLQYVARNLKARAE